MSESEQMSELRAENARLRAELDRMSKPGIYLHDGSGVDIRCCKCGELTQIRMVIPEDTEG